MGKFYVRKFCNGDRIGTTGCGSRGDNDKYPSQFLQMIVGGRKFSYRCGNRAFLPKHYRLEFIQNRHGEKKIYRIVSFDFDAKSAIKNLKVDDSMRPTGAYGDTMIEYITRARTIC